jgi:hypothetical protein
MENPAKKLKIDDDSSTNPFFKLHEDIHSLILQHLTAKEVLDLFTVSSNCNQVVSESPAAFKKIQFYFREISSENPSPQEVTALLNSFRKYRNVKATFTYLTNAIRKLLLDLQCFSKHKQATTRAE